jgi:hypothetical protein
MKRTINIDHFITYLACQVTSLDRTAENCRNDTGFSSDAARDKAASSWQYAANQTRVVIRDLLKLQTGFNWLGYYERGEAEQRVIDAIRANIERERSAA